MRFQKICRVCLPILIIGGLGCCLRVPLYERWVLACWERSHSYFEWSGDRSPKLGDICKIFELDGFEVVFDDGVTADRKSNRQEVKYNGNYVTAYLLDDIATDYNVTYRILPMKRIVFSDRGECKGGKESCKGQRKDAPR